MWPCRSHLIKPLNLLTGKSKFIWTANTQNSFDKVKRMAAEKTMLKYPDFHDKFILHTNASNIQLGAPFSPECSTRRRANMQLRRRTLECCRNPLTILHHFIWANYWGPHQPQKPHLSRNSAQSTRATTEITPGRIWSPNQIYTRETKCSHRCLSKVTN